MRLYIYPDFGSAKDKGDGGVRRVVEAQRRYLPEHGIEIVEKPSDAEVLAVHIHAEKQLLERYPNIPLVVHSHGLYWAEYAWKEEVGDWPLKANTECLKTIRASDALTGPSEWVAQALRRNSLREVAAIGHGVDLEEWPAKPVGRKARRSGYVLWNKTRPDPVCDPEDVNELARRVPDVAFLSTFGDDELPNMTVTGRRPYGRAKDLVRDAGVYLCTARETFGIGTLEAMAAGVPVLAWDWGGQSDIVEHKVTGWLAKPGDYDDLVAGLRYCLEHAGRMAKAARKRVEEHYQWRNVIDAYAELYRRVLAKSQEERPKISVAVRAYGLDQYLEAALDSVLAQKEQDWECIIVDDASPDRCGEIAEDYAARDGRFRVIHNAENQFIVRALNTGISAARGRYILSLDADNMLPPNALKLLSAALDSNRKIHIAYGNVEFLEPDGRRWHSGWPPEFKAELQVMRRTKDGDRPANLIPSSAMHRREVWELTGGYRERYRNGEDADFWMRATSYGFEAERVTEADTLVYRNREDSVSRREQLQDWSVWYPWARGYTAAPAVIALDQQVPVPSCEPVLVSVVIPVGPGHEELYIDAVDSVDAQAFRLWECIIVNDSGHSLRWVPSWARLIETSGKVGVGAARNLGIQAAKAKLFLPLDADDTLEVNALTLLYRTQQEFGGVAYSDWYEKWEGQKLKVWQTPEYDAHDLLKRGCIHAITALYERDDWEKVGGFDAEIPAWEDWDFQLKMAEIGVCGTRIPEPLFTYRKDTGMRREDNYSNFEANKVELKEKWKAYFEGGKELMACGGCAKKAARRVSEQSAASAGLPIPASPRSAPRNGDGSGQYVIIEYVGRKQGTLNYRGPSGTKYRFSASLTERRKYVAAGDAEYFLGKVDFREGQAEEA